MKKTQIILTAITLIMLVFIPNIAFGTNENLVIFKESTTSYLIYLDNLSGQNFSFEFANSTNPDKTDTAFNLKSSILDNEDNNIAYVDSNIITTFFSDSTLQTYLFVKVGEEYVIDGVEIDLTDYTEQTELDFISNITKQINVDTTETITTTVTEGNTTTTSTVGKIDITDSESATYYYQLVQVDNFAEYTELVNLADQIATFNSNTDFYDVLNTYKTFLKIYNRLIPEEISTEWIPVQEMKILQPEESKNNDRYVVWLKKEVTGEPIIIDAQFLVCYEQHEQNVEKKEIVTTETVKLPVTYDNIVVYLGILLTIIFIIILLIIKARVEKNEKNKN